MNCLKIRKLDVCGESSGRVVRDSQQKDRPGRSDRGGKVRWGGKKAIGSHSLAAFLRSRTACKGLSAVLAISQPIGFLRLGIAYIRCSRGSAAVWRYVWHGAGGHQVGLDPIEERGRAKRELSRNLYLLKGIVLDTFESRKAELKGDGKAGRWFNPQKLHVLPKPGKVPVADIDQTDIRDCLAPIWHEKALGRLCQTAVGGFVSQTVSGQKFLAISCHEVICIAFCPISVRAAAHFSRRPLRWSRHG